MAFSFSTRIRPSRCVIRRGRSLGSTAGSRTTSSASSVGAFGRSRTMAPKAAALAATSPNRSYHASAIHSSSAEEGDATTTTRTSWADLIASKIDADGAKSAASSFQRPSWSEEWKRLGLGAELVEDTGSSSSSSSNSKYFPKHLFFVQLGFGVDQHGQRLGEGFATKAAIRAVRNAIEFNSIPGVIDHLPGGRHQMLIHVKLGVPNSGLPSAANAKAAAVDALEVAKVFPYGRLLPIEIVNGGLEFHSGRVVEELGDEDDVGICCVACVSIGHNQTEHENGDDNDDDNDDSTVGGGHKTYNTKDGY